MMEPSMNFIINLISYKREVHLTCWSNEHIISFYCRFNVPLMGIFVPVTLVLWIATLAPALTANGLETVKKVDPAGAFAATATLIV